MTQQIKEILGNLLFKYEDAEDDIVIIQTKFEQMEAQLKAKDEEIERLKADCEVRLDTWRSKIWNMPYYAETKKARSIVAMLFWEWKKQNRLYIENKYRNPSANLALYKQASLMQETFQEAYKILKDTK